MVCWALNDPENDDQVRELAAAIEAQREIPGVLTIESGPRTKQVDWAGPTTCSTTQWCSLSTTSTRSGPPAPPDTSGSSRVLIDSITGVWIARSITCKQTVHAARSGGNTSSIAMGSGDRPD